MEFTKSQSKIGGFSVRGSFFLILALTVLLAGSGLFGILTVQRNNEALVSEVLMTEDLNLHLKSSLLKAREQDSYFRFEANVAALKLVRTYVAESGNYAKQITEIGLTQEIIDQVALIKTAILAYNTTFFETATNIQTRGGGLFGADNGLVGDMRNTNHQIEDLTLALYEQNAINNETKYQFLTNYLLLRRHEKDYLLRHNDPNTDQTKYPSKFEVEYGEFKTIFQSSTAINTTMRAQFLSDLDMYYTAFFAVVQIDTTIRGQTDTFNLKAGQVITLADHLAELASAAQKEGLATNASQEQALITITVVVSLVTILLTMFVSRTTSSNILNPIAEMKEEVELVSRGDLRHNKALGSSGSKEIRELGIFLDTMISDLANLVGGMVMSAEILSGSAEQLSTASEETNAAAEEVSSTSQSMSQAASQQAEMISTSVTEISKIGNVVTEIINTIKQNSDVISQIALQTNILALNAGIEASRAGDYGRGFAVVAENVRRLSEESKNAAEEINSVAGSISQTLVEAFDSIKLQIEEVAALSEETAASAEEVAAAAEEVTSSMEQVAAASQDLSEASNDSMDKTSRFTLK